jgi:hypothetical protein
LERREELGIDTLLGQSERLVKAFQELHLSRVDAIGSANDRDKPPVRRRFFRPGLS